MKPQSYKWSETQGFYCILTRLKILKNTNDEKVWTGDLNIVTQLPFSQFSTYSPAVSLLPIPKYFHHVNAFLQLGPVDEFYFNSSSSVKPNPTRKDFANCNIAFPDIANHFWKGILPITLCIQSTMADPNRIFSSHDLMRICMHGLAD